MKRGFTLIEVMVVLSILAIITILGYNFFGNMVKEAKQKQAATRLYKEMVSAEAAWEEYERQTGGKPDGWYYNVTNQQTFKDEAVAMGIVREFPSPDPSISRPGVPNVWTAENDGFCIGALVLNFGGPTGANDVITTLNGINDETCRAFNKYFSPVGDDLPTDTYLNLLGSITSGARKMPICVSPTDKTFKNVLWSPLIWK